MTFLIVIVTALVIYQWWRNRRVVTGMRIANEAFLSGITELELRLEAVEDRLEEAFPHMNGGRSDDFYEHD